MSLEFCIVAVSRGFRTKAAGKTAGFHVRKKWGIPCASPPIKTHCWNRKGKKACGILHTTSAIQQLFPMEICFLRRWWEEEPH